MSFYLLLVIFHFLVIYLYILYLFVIILFSSGQDCGLLRPPYNGWIFGSKTTHPHSVIFSCGVGFTLDGSSERTCLRNGSWSGQQPKCRRKTMCLPTLNDRFSAFSDNDILNTSKIWLYARKGSITIATSRGRLFFLANSHCKST